MYVEWLRTKLKERGRGAQGKLASHLGIEPSAVTRILNDERQIKADELPKMAVFFGENPPQPEADTAPKLVPIMGYIGAGAIIEPEFEQVPPEGLEQIEIAFPISAGMIGFMVVGDSMRPRYDPGDVVICWRDTPRDLDSLIGEEAAVRTSEGLRYLKRIAQGPRKNTVNLESWNYAETIKAVRLDWFSPVYLTLRAGQLRRLEKKRARK